MDPDEDQLDKLRKCMANTFDPDRLIDQAVKEGLGGFLYRNLLKADLLTTIKEIHQQKIYSNYYLTVRRNLKLMHALNTILEQLNKEKVRVILLQGISLLQQVYQDIGLRPMQNMDLWVLPNDYPKLVNSLIGLDFERYSSFPDTFKKGDAVVSIHSRIPRTGEIPSIDNSYGRMQEYVFSKAVKIHIDGHEVLCLSPQDQFLYLGLHAVERSLARLVWLVDIKSLILGWRPSDWEALVVRADTPEHTNTLFSVLFLLKGIFEIEFPASISSRLDSWEPHISTKRVLHGKLSGRSLPKWRQLMLIPEGDGLRHKPFCFIDNFICRREGLNQILAKATHIRLRQPCWKKVLQLLGYSKAH
jgi:hypothetical protein